MANVYLYEAGFLKKCPPVQSARFSQVLLDRDKKEYLVPIAPPPISGGFENNRFEVFLSSASGTLHIEALGRTKRIQIANQGDFEALI
jgi:hypothetical protein